MQLKTLAAAGAALSLAIGSFAGAQTAGTPTEPDAAAASPAETLSDTVTVLAWPKAEVALSDDSEPVAASFALGTVEGIDPALTTGVTANGYARKVAVEDQSVGQVLITTLAKDDKEAVISSEGLSAQFDATDSSELFPEKTVEVTGSRAALLAALQKLAETDSGEDEEVAASEEAPAMSTSDGSSNDLAWDYTTPKATAAEEEEEEEPTTTTSLTTDGCSVVVDTDAGVAYEQNRLLTYTDGVLSEESECSNSGTTYPLKKSYVNCDDEVDAEGLKAWSLYTLYYVDGSAETHAVGECTKDEESYYAITEDENQCTVFLDFKEGVVVPQSALVYTNRNNAVVQARGCEDSTLSEPIELTESMNNCNLRHDFEAEVSYQQSMWTYLRDGITYVASACADTGVTYEHQVAYTDDAGAYICDVVTDLDGGTATLQSRKAITVDGEVRYITSCTPETETQSVFATMDGCLDLSTWKHDVSAGVSYGQERYYFDQDDGSRYYVTGCQTSGETFVHDHALTGYQYHDDQLYAYPMTTVSVTVNDDTYTVANSTVLEGAQQYPYVLDGTTEEQTGQSTYEGCDGYSLTNEYEQWERPDGTVYLKAIGEGDPVGPRNVCDTEVTEKYVQTSLAIVEGGVSCGYWDDDQYKQRPGSYVNCYATNDVKTVYTNRETGEHVTTTYAWGDKSSTSHCTSSYGYPMSPSCSGFQYQTVVTDYWSFQIPGSGSSWTRLTVPPENF